MYFMNRKMFEEYIAGNRDYRSEIDSHLDSSRTATTVVDYSPNIINRVESPSLTPECVLHKRELWRQFNK